MSLRACLQLGNVAFVTTIVDGEERYTIASVEELEKLCRDVIVHRARVLLRYTGYSYGVGTREKRLLRNRARILLRNRARRNCCFLLQDDLLDEGYATGVSAVDSAGALQMSPTAELRLQANVRRSGPARGVPEGADDPNVESWTRATHRSPRRAI